MSINGADSEKEKILCCVPRGCLMGPFLFLLFINDLPLLFADDTTFPNTNIATLFEDANIELDKAFEWLKANKCTRNVKKTKFMLFSDKNLQTDIKDLQIKIGGKILDQVGTNCKEQYFKLGSLLMTKSHGKNILTICAFNSIQDFLPPKNQINTVPQPV